jgi:hypothetical protein
MGFATHRSWTLPTIVLHTTLTCSAFCFAIPLTRIKSGDRIWPENRLHSLVFLCRSFALMALYEYEYRHQLEPRYLLNLLIVLATMLAADVASWSVGAAHCSRTIRDLDAPLGVKFFFSWMQLVATAGCLYGLRRCSLVFFMAFIIQLTPFLMTLRRKNLLSKNFILTVYGVTLVFLLVLNHYEYSTYAANGLTSFGCQIFIAGVGTLLRLGPRLPIVRHVQDNKYLLWVLLSALMRLVRPVFDQPLSRAMWTWSIGVQVATLLLGCWKSGLSTYLDPSKAN